MNSKNYKVLFEVLISILILFLPFSVQLHELFSGHNEATISIFGYEYLHGFTSLASFTWFLLIHLMPIVLVSLWYLTNSYPWRKILLFSLFVQIFRFINNLGSSLSEMAQFFVSVSLGILYVTLLFVLSRKFYRNLKFSSIHLGFAKKIRLEKLLKFLEGNPKFENLEKVKLPELIHLDGIIKNELTLSKEVRNIAMYKTLIYVLIFSFTVILYVHKLFPEGVKEFVIFGIEFYDLDFEDFSVLVWVLALKVSLLGLMSIWFLTCKSWWRLAILSPIAVSIFQLWEIISNTNYDIDIAYFSRSLPIVILLIGILLYISKKVDYANRIIAIQIQIEQKVENLILEKIKNKKY